MNPTHVCANLCLHMYVLVQANFFCYLHVHVCIHICTNSCMDMQTCTLGTIFYFYLFKTHVRVIIISSWHLKYYMHELNHWFDLDLTFAWRGSPKRVQIFTYLRKWLNLPLICHELSNKIKTTSCYNNYTSCKYTKCLIL